MAVHTGEKQGMRDGDAAITVPCILTTSGHRAGRAGALQ
ncbi:hypothetical protein L535_1940 [Bordetella bronchiseptica SBL-F6116]|nr:hypothetical protein L535_1940 [Bordetella bronchiseptica SBL-F6116]